MNPIWLILLAGAGATLSAVASTFAVLRRGRGASGDVEYKPAKVTPLVAMSDEERLNEQRSLITEKALTHPVEFIATLADVPGRYEKSDRIATEKRIFGSTVERALKGYFPLGGRIHVLPVSTSEHVIDVPTSVHCVAHLEARHEVDAHEVAELACKNIMKTGLGNPYARVTFIPVEMDSPLRAGYKPGLWDITYTSGKAEGVRYANVATRKSVREPRRVDTPPSDTQKWVTARETLDRVALEFAEFEFSPMDVALTRRLLWDLTEPATARFYEAFDAANMLRTDTSPSDPSAFIDAAERARVAWEAADRNARNKAEQNISSGGVVLTPDAVRHRDTAAAAMSLALDAGTPAPEAGLAWRKANEAMERAGMRVPPSWQKKIESTELVSRALKALPQGESA